MNIEITDKTDYLTDDTALNKFANEEIRKCIEYVSRKIEALNGDDDFVIDFYGHPQSLIQTNDFNIVWESDTEQYDADIRAFIKEYIDQQ